MVNLFIANLDWEITSEDLESTFSAFGPVTYAHVVYDNATKRSKGFGYIEMEETDHGINAINALNGMDINGRKLDVKIASPKSNRPAKKEVKPTLKKVEKKPFKKFDNKPKSNYGEKPKYGEKTVIKPNPVERDSEGRVIRKVQ
jgi:RNA recognition motif-containing protein